MKKYLIANIGSASKKYALYDGAQEIFSMHFERVMGSGQVTVVALNESRVAALSEREYTDSLQYAATEMTSNMPAAVEEIAAIGLRIVAPGTFFQEHKKIDDAYIQILETLHQEEPLHIGPILSEIRAMRESFPNVAVYGLSDSAFHARMPEPARVYAVDEETAEALDIKRFGYHGFSFASTVRTLRSAGVLPGKIVICHLGSGASIAAIRDGECADSSMGFSPLEGLVMATRVGDIDAGALIRIASRKNLSPEALENYLYTQCGLFGLSGTTGDVRDLLQREAEGDIRAKLALDTFVYRIRKYIGAYSAALGGLDMLVLTGTIGERSAVIRSRVCADLDFLGIKVHAGKNSDLMDASGMVDIGDGPTKVVAIHSRELEEMALVVAEVASRT